MPFTFSHCTVKYKLKIPGLKLYFLFGVNTKITNSSTNIIQNVQQKVEFQNETEYNFSRLVNNSQPVN